MAGMAASSQRVIPVDLAILGFLNAYLVRGDRTVVVDTGYPSATGRILRALQANRIAREDVSLILLTHGHLDHLGGARSLRETLKVPVALHRLDAEIARTGRDRPLIGTDLAGRLFARIAPRTAPAFEPDVVHDGELDLVPYGIDGRTIATPGHTPGSVSVLLPDAVIAGDLLAGGYLRRHAPRLPYFADDLVSLRASMRAMARDATGPLLLGHRGPVAPDALQRWLDATEPARPGT